MKNTLSLLVLSALLFSSCKKEEIAEAPPTEEVTAEVVHNPTAPATTQQVQPVNSGTASGSVMTSQPQVTAQSYSTTAPTTATAKGMNPPHGQPGHRCDISVGAPLNSAPKNTAGSATVTQATNVTPAMMNVVEAPAKTETTPVVTAPGMNPPHGQEGHVCGVAVGAPLPKKE